MAITFVNSAVASSSPNTATSITLPTLSANDLIIIAAAVGDSANNGIPAPTGYSRVPGVAATLYGNGSGADTNLDLYYKIAVGGDSGASVTLTATGGTNASNAGIAYVLRGIDTATPFDTNANTTTGTSTASGIDPPSHDHSGASGTWVVIAGSCGHTGGDTTTGSAPSGYSNFVQRAHNDSFDIYVFMASRSNPADPENPGVVSPSPIGTASADGYAAVTMSIKPAATPITIPYLNMARWGPA
jgi:hypothetical protein